MTPRAARRRLGTRTIRRAGTKTKALPGRSGKKGQALKSRYPHGRKERPAVGVARLLRAV